MRTYQSHLLVVLVSGGRIDRSVPARMHIPAQGEVTEGVGLLLLP